MAVHLFTLMLNALMVVFGVLAVVLTIALIYFQVIV